MKKLLFLVATAVAGAGSLSAAWTYDATEGTISDGVWKFGATVKSGTTELTVNAVQVAPSEVSPLDFSMPVTDDSTTYTIVELNPQFGGEVDQWGNLPMAKAESGFVGELTIPTAGLKKIGVSAFYNCTNATGTVTLGQELTTIGSAAFCKCTKLTSVEPVVPDSVTSIGMLTFHQVNVPKAVRLQNVNTLNRSVFKGSEVESVYVGPGLKKITGANNGYGAFESCKNLTNLTFSSDITNAVIDGTHQFCNCPNIESVLDFTGFKKLSATWTAFEHSKKVKKVKIGVGIEEISSAFFNGLGGLEEMYFAGKPPKTFSTPLYSGLGASQFVTTFVPVAYSNEWSVYAKDGVINESSSTYSSTYFSAAVVPYRALVFPDSGGGGGGELGDGVFDESTGTLTMPGGWAFNATKLGVNLTVGSCMAAPATPSPLDFSVRITDVNGREINVLNINTEFGTETLASANSGPVFTRTMNFGADKVASLVLPTNGLAQIMAGAFACCSNLAGPLKLPDGLLSIGDFAFESCVSLDKIENYVPDSVTSVGKGAFANVPANGALRLENVQNTSASSFYNSGIESVYFGPALKNLTWGHFSLSTFRDAVGLTNITFATGISNATWSDDHGFLHCTKIAGVLDLSGFKKVTTSWGIFGGTVTETSEIIFGENLAELGNGWSAGLTGAALTNVSFKGAPPTTFPLPYLQGPSKTKVIATHVPRKSIAEKNASGKCWLDYSADGAIHHKGTTWAQAHIVSGVDPTLRPLLTIEPDGLMMIIK